MANIVISIDPEGTATYLVNKYTEGLFPDAAVPRRASHVVPLSQSARFWFKALRGAFGEDGMVGDWTRNWKGPWLVDMSPIGGLVHGIFPTRDEAIEFEINWLNKNFLGR
jgi:hypothetical protein